MTVPGAKPSRSRLRTTTTWRAVTLAAFCLWPVWGVAQAVPTDAYDKVTRNGWTVFVSPDYASRPDARNDILRHIAERLDAMETVLPPPAIPVLQRAPVWLEWATDGKGRAVYHVSAKWLERNGYNPDKAGGIEVTQYLLARTERAPWTLLHEYAHAWQYAVLGRDNPDLIAAHDRAKSSGLYDDVLRSGGSRARAWALENPREFFAEMSEAYFARNDFEPFDAEALRATDPETYALIGRLWGLEEGAN